MFYLMCWWTLGIFLSWHSFHNWYSLPFLIMVCFLYLLSDVPDPPIDVELMACESRLAQIQWKLINENYSPVIQFVIQYNTSFDPDTWRVAKGSLARDRCYQRIAVSPWGNYSFRVIAQNGVGYSKPSHPTRQICHMPPDVPHHNPSNVCTRNGKPHTLVITWKVRIFSFTFSFITVLYLQIWVDGSWDAH